MKRVSTTLRSAVVLLILLISACASTPHASPDRDALAKEFLTHPDAATIYVYRSPFNDQDFNSVLFMNGRLVGKTVPAGFFRIDTVPGVHVLHGTGIDLGQFAVHARAGQVYFVALDVLAGQSNFRIVPDYIAQARVRACCALLENWMPATGPILVR
jgi:hypothetical protein